MCKCFYPKYYYSATQVIDYKNLYESGKRGIIFDIDNTIVPHNVDGTKESDALILSLIEQGFQVCILSNNHEPRVKRLVRELPISYQCDAKKPLRGGYIKAAEKMHLTIDQCVFVGDQIFTDILGANMAKMDSVLVQPINPNEPFQIRLKRVLEKPFIKAYEKKYGLNG